MNKLVHNFFSDNYSHNFGLLCYSGCLLVALNSPSLYGSLSVEIKSYGCLVSYLPDSPDLSLLIQNKGNGPLNVTISAPIFVQLEKRNIQLQQKEDIKVHITNIGSVIESMMKSSH